MRHKNCYYCGNDGFIFKSLRYENLAIVADIKIEKKHEGWPGIPHGGVAMVSFVELIDIAQEYPPVFPYEYRFRFGGERLKCGDHVRCIVQNNGPGNYTGTFGKSLLYPYCQCFYSATGVHNYDNKIVETAKKYMEAETPFVIPNMSSRLINAFSSGYENRLFHITDYAAHKSYLIARMTAENNFITGGDSSINNGVLCVLLDETMGWSAFLSVWQAGVTVELQITFFDKVYNSDVFYITGFCDSVRGDYGKKITTSYGNVLAQRGSNLAVIASAKGRWLTMPGFKELMINYMKKNTG